MNLKELRNSVGVRQSELVAALNKEGLRATEADISRIENGIIETYLFLAFRAEELLKRKTALPKAKKRNRGEIWKLQPHCRASYGKNRAKRLYELRRFGDDAYDER